MNRLTLFWRDGALEIVRGKNPADAMNRAGYGAGALRALDFYADGVSTEYTWDAAKRSWVKAAAADARAHVAAPAVMDQKGEV